MANRVVVYDSQKTQPDAVQLQLTEHQNRVYLKSIDSGGVVDTLLEFQLNSGKLVYDRHGPVLSDDIQKDMLDKISPNIIGQ